MPISGTVTHIDARTAKTKFGEKPVFDIYVDGTKYSWGFADPVKMGVSLGAVIEFDFTSDKFGYKVLTPTVKVTTMGSGAGAVISAPVATLAAAAPSGGGGGGKFDCGFPIPVRSEKISILRQNALTNARELLTNFPSNFLGGAGFTGKDVIAAVLEIAKQFADYTSGRDAERAAEAITHSIEKGN